MLSGAMISKWKGFNDVIFYEKCPRTSQIKCWSCSLQLHCYSLPLFSALRRNEEWSHSAAFVLFQLLHCWHNVFPHFLSIQLSFLSVRFGFFSLFFFVVMFSSPHWSPKNSVSVEIIHKHTILTCGPFSCSAVNPASRMTPFGHCLLCIDGIWMFFYDFQSIYSLLFWFCWTFEAFVSRHLTFRLGADAQGSFDSYCGGHLVVFYPNHHLLLHGQLGCLPHCGTNGCAHRLSRRPGETD